LEKALEIVCAMLHWRRHQTGVLASADNAAK